MDEFKELPPEAVICKQEVTTAFATVKVGQVAGLRSVAVGLKAEKEVITLEFISHINVKRAYDAIVIKGESPTRERIQCGVHGDIGTIGMVFDMIPKVLSAPPGLVTMVNLPLASACLGDMREYVDWRALKASKT